MAAIFAFKCSCCGEVHEGSPSFGFQAPDQYAHLSMAEKSSRATLTEDFCTIEHGAGTDRFIRAVLEIPIHGVEEPFLWGVWVSVSEASYQRYRDTSSEPAPGDGFFGWVCNQIAIYPSTSLRPSDVYLQPDRNRPKVVLHRGEPEIDPLVIDQMNGITVARAQELAERAMHEA